MTDHDAAAREIISSWLLNNTSTSIDYAEIIQGEPVVHEYEAVYDASCIIAALSAAGFQVLPRTPEGMVSISRDTAEHAVHAMRVYRDGCLNPTVKQRWAEYAAGIQQDIDRAEGESGG